MSNPFDNFPSCSEPLDLLVIAPHPDDAELGMGGTIAKLVKAGWKVGILDVTNGEPTPFGSIEKRTAETEVASKALGVNWRFNLGLRNRFVEPTIENRQKMAEVFRLAKPKWLFAPYWEDAHPDHVAVTQIVEAARFWSKLTKSEMAGDPFHPQRIFYYFCIHLKLIREPAFIIDISDHWETKRNSIEAYHSQFIEGRPTAKPTLFDQWESEAAFWGKSIGVHYGEPFASREPIGLRSFNDLL